MFINFNACAWLLSLSSWSLPSLLLAFTCTKREYCLCIQSLKPPKLFQMSPLYLPIWGIYLPFQVNLYVPNSKPSNEILFCMLEQLMLQLGLPICSMLGGLFSRGVDSAPHSRERAGNRDAQSHDPKRSKQIKIIKKTPPELLYVGGTRCFKQAMDWCLLVVGGA